MKDKINIGVIGLGERGYYWIKGELVKLENVQVTYVCDVYEDRVDRACKLVEETSGVAPKTTLDYYDVINSDDVDVVMVITAWESHTQIAVSAMKASKFVAMEVGGAYSIEECWELVNTYEETKTPFMFMENCCYGQYEMMIMNMVKKGVFGDIVHCEGGYCHDLRKEVAFGEENRHYRLRNYINRNCENYPTHELGPIAKILKINRGNRLVSLQSFASGAKGMREYIANNKAADDKLANTVFKQADIVKTFIYCENGETIELTLDTTLPRFYSRGFTIRGTKAMYSEDTNVVFMDKIHEQYDFNARPIWDNAKEYHEKYYNELWKNPQSLYESGHGGMDYLLLQAILHCYKESEIPTIDVYDAALWMSITALSEISINNNGARVDIPDFTSGKYKNREDHNTSVFSLE